MKNSLLSALGLVAALGMAETAAAQTQAYVRWPLTRNNSDSTAVRSANVTPITPVFRRYVISNGQSNSGTTAYAPYSSLGQAFGVNADGSGWSSNNTPPGPGSSPRRTYYERFSFTATAAVQVDSLIFSAAVPSSANGKVAVVYSRSGFTADSTDITGGKGPTGVLPSGANGTFGLSSTGGMVQTATAGAVLPQFDATAAKSARTFRLALNGATGLVIPSGQTFSVRLYFGVGSTGIGRYILLSDVILKSKQAVVSSAANACVVKNGLALSPNPATSQVVVNHPTAKNGGVVSVYTTTGQKVATLATQNGTERTTLDLDKLAAGLYLVEYADAEQRATSRIVKQ